MKHKFKCFYMVVVCAMVSQTAYSKDSECGYSEKMGAVYDINVSSEDTSNVAATQQRIELWRNGDQVAIHYPQRQITELWHQTSNGQLQLVRYFDSYQRGIEYLSIEIKGGHDWSVKRQLISNAFREKMQPGDRSGQGCEEVQHYSLKQNHASYDLEWLGQLDLLKQLNVKSEESMTNTQWTLQQIIKDEAQVDKKFAQLSHYQTIDFADIGDSENDPFLRKMIRLGFVEHGNSGFYDTEGHDIGSHGH